MPNKKPRAQMRRKSKAKKKALPTVNVSGQARQSSGRKISGKKVRRAAKKKRSSRFAIVTKPWQSYEGVARYLLDQFAAEFGLDRVEGKQNVLGKESGTSW